VGERVTINPNLSESMIETPQANPFYKSVGWWASISKWLLGFELNPVNESLTAKVLEINAC
jgi:hypothetical protein